MNETQKTKWIKFSKSIDERTYWIELWGKVALFCGVGERLALEISYDPWEKSVTLQFISWYVGVTFYELVSNR